MTAMPTPPNTHFVEEDRRDEDFVRLGLRCCFLERLIGHVLHSHLPRISLPAGLYVITVSTFLHPAEMTDAALLGKHLSLLLSLGCPS